MTNEKQLTDDANVNWGPLASGRQHIAYATTGHGIENYLMRDDGSHRTHSRTRRRRRAAGLLAGWEVSDVDKQAAKDQTSRFFSRFKLPQAP